VPNFDAGPKQVEQYKLQGQKKSVLSQDKVVRRTSFNTFHQVRLIFFVAHLCFFVVVNG